MPIYEYRCNDCGVVFDNIRKMEAADEPIACDQCQSSNTTRLLSKCYAHNQSGAISSSSGSCAGCSGGTCSTCGH